MSKFAIIYASKGKSTEEIAKSLEYYAGAINVEVNAINLYKAQKIDFYKAIKLIQIADLVAFGSPTYNNGKPLLEMEELFEKLVNVEISGKKTMVFGAYGWGRCESVDFLIQKCREKGVCIFEKGTLNDAIGLRLHTKEIRDDRIIRDYLAAFMGQTIPEKKCEKLVLPEAINEQIRGVDAYRQRLNAYDAQNLEFENCRFVRVDFSKQFFSHVRFHNCIFWYSNFDGATLSNVTFESCDVTDCSFRSVSFEQTTLKECDLSESELYDSDLLDININKVRMENVTFDADLSKPVTAKQVLEKHELNHNYYAASKIHSQLYNNAKETDNYELAQLFYARKMENLRKFYFHQSAFYTLYLGGILLLQKLARLLKNEKVSLYLQNTYSSNSTQALPANSVRSTLRYLLLVILKVVTGNTISIIRLLCFSGIAIIASGAVLVLCNIPANLNNVNTILPLALRSVQQSIYYTFGVGVGSVMSSGSLDLLVCYFDGFLGIVIEAVFAYILIEKMTR